MPSAGLVAMSAPVSGADVGWVWAREGEEEEFPVSWGRRAVVPPQERELDMQDTKIRWRLGGRGENTLM